MTHSTNYGDLLRRQAELQRLGNLPTPTLEQVRVALLTEIGELAQELKPDWVWWSKPGAKKEVDREKVRDELADVLHFILLAEIILADEEDDYDSDVVMPTFKESLVEALAHLAEVLCTDEPDAVYGIGYLCGIAARYGFTPDDLASAYWQKTEINLTRWREAARE